MAECGVDERVPGTAQPTSLVATATLTIKRRRKHSDEHPTIPVLLPSLGDPWWLSKMRHQRGCSLVYEHSVRTNGQRAGSRTIDAASFSGPDLREHTPGVK
jgi:hypothetical protein